MIKTNVANYGHICENCGAPVMCVMSTEATLDDSITAETESVREFFTIRDRLLGIVVSSDKEDRT